MEEKYVHQFNNFGTIHQFNAGANATLIYKDDDPAQNVVRPASADDAIPAPVSDAVQALACYVHDADRCAAIVEQLRRATSAHDIAFRVVAGMEDLPAVDAYVVVKERFIQPLVDLAENVGQGRSVNNVREQINKMLRQNKWKR